MPTIEQMLPIKRPTQYLQKLSLHVGMLPNGEVAIYLSDNWDTRLTASLKDLYEDAIELITCPHIGNDMRKELGLAAPSLRGLADRIDAVLEQYRIASKAERAE